MQEPISAPENRILIVEDDEDIRAGLLEFLELEGYHAHGVTNGREALDFLQTPSNSKEIRLILLDLMMPQMDGRQFRLQQQKTPQISEIPVIVMSADNAVQQRSAELNVQGCLKKPIDLDQLLQAIQDALAGNMRTISASSSSGF